MKDAAIKETLKKIIAGAWNFAPAYIARNKAARELVLKKPSLVLVGPRRAGKSYAAYEIKDAVANAANVASDASAGKEKNDKNEKREKRENHDFVFVNFEDERLAGFKREHFDLILEAYYELREETREAKPAVFLDEIQNVAGWEQFVRRLADEGYKTIVTGSNSKMLSREIAEKLGGRFVEVTIYPLDFKEFLKFKGMEFKQEFFYSKERFAVKKFFSEYFAYGGFPEAALLDGEESKKKILQTYFDLVFYKDLVSRKRLENENALKFIVKKTRESIGNVVSPRAVYAAAKNAGVELSPNTVEKYSGYLEEAFLIMPCAPFAKSVLKQERRKKYFIDNGYVKIFEVKADEGIMLENLVFTELLKKGRVVRYHLGKRECDFIVDGGQAVQVAYELNDDNKEREIEGVVEAMNAYKIREGVIVTYDQETEIKTANNKRIKVVPAWKWCLQL